MMQDKRYKIQDTRNFYRVGYGITVNTSMSYFPTNIGIYLLFYHFIQLTPFNTWYTGIPV